MCMSVCLSLCSDCCLSTSSAVDRVHCLTRLPLLVLQEMACANGPKERRMGGKRKRLRQTESLAVAEKGGLGCDGGVQMWPGLAGPGFGGLVPESTPPIVHPSWVRLGGRMPGSLTVGGGRGRPLGTSPVKLPLSATQEAEPAQGPALHKHRPPGPLGKGPAGPAQQGPWDPELSKSCALPHHLDGELQTRPVRGPRGAGLGQAREGP